MGTWSGSGRPRPASFSATTGRLPLWLLLASIRVPKNLPSSAELTADSAVSVGCELWFAARPADRYLLCRFGAGLARGRRGSLATSHRLSSSHAFGLRFVVVRELDLKSD